MAVLSVNGSVAGGPRRRHRWAGRPLVLLHLKNEWVGLFIVCGGCLTLGKISAAT